MSPQWVYQQGYDNALYDARIAVIKNIYDNPQSADQSEYIHFVDTVTAALNSLRETDV